MYSRSVVLYFPLCEAFGSDKESVQQHIRKSHPDWQSRLGYRKPFPKTSAIKRKSDVVAEPMSPSYDPEDLDQGEESDENADDDFVSPKKVVTLLPNR